MLSRKVEIMIDVYVVSSDEKAIYAFCSLFKNVIGPLRGRAATKSYVDEAGNTIDAMPAIGDVAMFYACIRSKEDIKLPKEISVCDEKTGINLCGIWSR